MLTWLTVLNYFNKLLLILTEEKQQAIGEN